MNVPEFIRINLIDVISCSESGCLQDAYPIMHFDWLPWRPVIGLGVLVLFFIMSFRSFLKTVLRPPLWKYLGIKFEDIVVKPHRLTIKVKSIELYPLKSPILRGIFVAIFPSANVSILQKSDDYPESKISIHKMKIKLRIGTAVGTKISDTVAEVSNNGKASSTNWILRLLYYVFPRPVIDVDMVGVTFEIEKSYIAPDAPSEFHNNSQSTTPLTLPSAVVSSNQCGPEIPTFDQDYWLDFLRNDEILDADNITFLIERWINHAVSKLKKKQFQPDGLTATEKQTTIPKDIPVKERTDDEKTNVLITSIAEALCHSLSFRLSNASVIISGADSAYVKMIRKKFNPRRANIMLAKLPRRKRALTIIGADVISISFSPDVHCNLLFYFLNVYVKVGNPIPGAKYQTRASGASSCRETLDSDVQYAWHSIAHPFHLVAEIIGVVPFLTWILNYDHYWETRSIGVNISTTEVNVTLTPEHLHTVFLHLDDFTDPMSPLNEWLAWLNKKHLQTLGGVSENEKLIYSHNFARINGTKFDENETLFQDAQKLSSLQMKDMEKRMTRHEIISLRCIAMEKKWRIPKENEEFSRFLRQSRSRINEKNERNQVTPLDAPSPFQRIHPSPLGALVTLIIGNNSFFSPLVTMNFTVKNLHLDFPYEQDSARKHIPSSITVTGVSFGLKQTSPFFSLGNNSVAIDSPRPFLNLKFQAQGIEWNVLSTDVDEHKLPAFRDGSIVGLIYKRQQDISSENILSIELNVATTPTQEQGQFISLAFQTCNLAIVVNPLPLLSSIATLIELSDLPFRPIDKENLTLNGVQSTQTELPRAVVTLEEPNKFLTLLHTSLVVVVENVSVLFMIDRAQISRGILDLKVDRIKIEASTSGMSGELLVLPEPLRLCAGQISFHQPHLTNGKIDWKLMPFKPIITVVGARLQASCKERHAGERSSNVTISEVVTMGIETKIGAESFAFNSSPTIAVALFGVIQSLEPIWGDSSNSLNTEEKERIQLEKRNSFLEEKTKLQFQREALLRIFNTIDVDDSCTLQEEELERAVLMLFAESSIAEGNESPISGTRQLTADELKRERDYLISVIDPAASNAVTFRDIDSVLFRMANKIDDNNLVPKIKATGVDYLDNFSHSDTFLSGPMLRKLVYFEDAREYSAMHEVYRITGHARLDKMSTFPVPSLWRQGQGIELFWEFYIRETGCTRTSLNGQEISSVQRKLVRSLSNYNFAKFCWKALVQPMLRAASDDLGNALGNTVTCWLLDDDPSILNTGAVDRLLQHVYQMSKVTREAQQKEKKEEHVPTIYQYEISVIAVVDYAVLSFGSAHTFTNPLFEVECTQVSISASTLLSQSGWFVPENEFSPSIDIQMASDNRWPENDNSNEVIFRSTLKVMYLNTKHDHMECFVEPYPCFGYVNYKVFLQDSNTHYSDTETSSFSVIIDCPRFLSMNALPAFFETASVFQKILSQSDPRTYRKMMFERDVNFVRNVWDTYECESGVLSRQEALNVLRSASEIHWKDELEGLSPNEIDDMIMAFVDSDGSRGISFSDIKRALRASTSRSYFSGCKEIQLRNSVGRDLKVSTKDVLERYRVQYPHMTESVLQQFLNSLQSIDAGNSAAISLKESSAQNKSRPHELLGRLFFFTDGYKMIDDVMISPYQSLMFPLTRRKKRPGRKVKRSRNASGFTPFLTVVPKSDSLDSITLDVRPSVTIVTEIPIKIRIVRLPKKLGYLRKRGLKSQIDLTKKNFLAALKRLVDGAAIVHERNNVTDGVADPLPLDLLDSSHYHALLIQDLTGNDSNSWRDPVLLTKDFLFNTVQSRDISQRHALSGVVVRKERLNVHISSRHRNKPFASDTNRSILQRTAWDTTILVVPFFLLSNSLPFLISVRTWQHSKDNDDDLWKEPAQYDDTNEENLSSDDDDTSSMTPSLRGKSKNSDQFHLPKETDQRSQFAVARVAEGDTLRLSGISLRQPLYIQVSQCVKTPGANQVNIMWSDPLKIRLDKMRTGVNKKGSFALPKLVLDIGDDCDALVDVSIERGIGMPMCTIYSPYWIMNKTGMKMEYKISGQSRRYLDSGLGGLPIMMHCGKFCKTNKIHHSSSREISAVPLEQPKCSAIATWWDVSTNGKLVLKRNAINDKGHHLVAWSEKIELDAAGTSGEIHCKKFILNASIESLAGAFHRSNLITLTPRFIVKNMMHISITLVPLAGQMNDAIRKANQLKKNLTEPDENTVELAPGESTIIYHFKDIFSQGIEKSYRWIAFCVNATRFRKGFHNKWHLIPVDANMRSTYFGEHDGVNDTMVGILEAKVHSSDGGSIVVSIAHAPVPPFRIENRSNTHCVQFVQDDEDAVVFELPPMHSCGYTWDSPLGKKRLRAVVVPKVQMKNHYLVETLDSDCYEGKTLADANDSDESVDSALEDVESIESKVANEPLLHSLKSGIHPQNEKDTASCSKSIGSSIFMKKCISSVESSDWSRRRRLYGRFSRSYKMLKVGRTKKLPCPAAHAQIYGEMNKVKMSSKLYVHIRILAGTKILSFSDSPWLAEQVDQGLLRKGGDFKSALCDINVDGFGFYLMDEFPREMIGVVVRDIQIRKPMGSIETTAKIRHFQIDSMLPNARYPIIIQPLPLGVDRRESSKEATIPGSVNKNECFWLSHDEKPVPIFEVTFSYVPQSNMIWIPNVDVFISPMKVQVDVDYLLRVAGIVVNSIYKYQDGVAENHTAITRANHELQYITRGQMNMCLTYIEKLDIAPVWFEVELNIKPDEAENNAENDAATSESALTLNTIARSTNSAIASGVLMWVINVGANFAHVSPTFRYSKITDTDRYCDVVDLIKEIAISYIFQTIKQSYKVIFSMHLLGDPTLLAYQYKTGISDLVLKTRDELSAGGKDGLGKGFASFFQHVVGGTFFAAGKVSSGLAKTIDSVTTNELTSNHLKPKLLATHKYPRHALDGMVKGTNFLGRTVICGVAGLIGNPYRGAKTGTVSGFTKGIASGLGGLIASPLVGVLGFIAKTADGVGATTKYLEIGVIEARCRPARTVAWGRPMGTSGLLYLKAIGIRIHTVSYQKVRKRVNQQDHEDRSEHNEESWQSSKEYKRNRAAEDRRKNPPGKVVSIVYEKEKRHHLTHAIKPKLLSDHPGNSVLSHYAVVFEETIILRSSDLQLDDEVAIHFRNNKIMKTGETRQPLAVCKLTVGDIYLSILHFYAEQLAKTELNLSEDITNNTNELFNPTLTSPSVGDRSAKTSSVIIPAPQEYSLFRPPRKTRSAKESISVQDDFFETIGAELASIQKAEEDARSVLDTESLQSDSDSSFLGGGAKTKDEGNSSLANGSERLFGSISLSFFPVPW